MLPTVEAVLHLPELVRGHPAVLAGESNLDRLVRWVHVSELPDIASMLSGGELVLTTGVALPVTKEALTRYVESLSDAGVAGLVIGLGRGFEATPPAIVTAARHVGLPLVELRSTVRFVTLTEAVHSLIVNAQFSELKRIEQTHDVFTHLGLEGSSVTAILKEAAARTGHPIVLENLAHQVLAFDGAGRTDEDLLHDWERQSRACTGEGRSQFCDSSAWWTTLVGARGETWGRVILVGGGREDTFQRVVLERAATAIAINRLVERDTETLEQQARRSILSDIMNRAFSSPQDLFVRVRALGLDIEKKSLVPVSIRLDHLFDFDAVRRQRIGRESARVVETAGANLDADFLVAAIGQDEIGVLIALAPRTPRTNLIDVFARTVVEGLKSLDPARSCVIGVGPAVVDPTEVGRAIHQAREVAEAAAAGDRKLSYHELPDVHLRGLLYLLRADPRVQSYVERQLGPLLAVEGPRGRDLLAALDAYLELGRNKSLAADQLHMSRPAFYHRLKSIEQILKVDLDAPETCLRLHVALLAAQLNTRTQA